MLNLRHSSRKRLCRLPKFHQLHLTVHMNQLRPNRQVREQQEANAALADDIAHSGEAEYLADIARSRLGLLEPDEIEFVDSSK